MNAIPYMLVCYGLVWISFLIGYKFIGIKNEISIKFEKFLWNARIDKMQHPPFTWVMKFAEKKNPILIIFVIAINATMVIMQMLLGLLLIGPLLLFVQGFMVGALIVQADRKTQIFSMIVLIFELGAFATACGLGLFLISEQIWFEKPIIENISDLYRSGILWIPLVLLILNGFSEGSAGLFEIEGVPGIQAVREKRYK